MRNLLLVVMLLLPTSLCAQEILIHETPNEALFLNINNSKVTTTDSDLNIILYSKKSEAVVSLQIKVDTIGDNLRVHILSATVYDLIGNVINYKEDVLFYILNPITTDPIDITIIKSLKLLIGNFNV